MNRFFGNNEQDFIDKIKQIVTVVIIIITLLGVFTLFISIKDLNTNHSEISEAKESYYDTLSEYDPDFYFQVFSKYYPKNSMMSEDLRKELIEMNVDTSKLMGDVVHFLDYSKGASEILITNTKSNIFNFFASKEIKDAKKDWVEQYKVTYNNQTVDDIVISLKEDKHSIVTIYYKDKNLIMDEFTLIYPADQNIVRYQNSTNELIPLAKGKTKLYLQHLTNIYVLKVTVK